MDAPRFDAFAKSFAVSMSRRGILGLTLGGIAARLFPMGKRVLGAECRLPGRTCDDVAPCCEGHCDEKDEKGDRRCVCPDGLTLCHSACVDTSIDVDNCGDCDVFCE